MIKGMHAMIYTSHAVSFYCDDIQSTISELEARGVQVSQPVEDKGYGLVTYLRVPGGLEIQLYQPSYEK